ncbi:MAG: hypothetical protein KC547_11675 [Anaerolineae bacterium]|nr:hypothetical protein [Anaerolineae bacterium]
MTTINADSALEESRRRHRREVLLYILLPLLGGVLLIGVVMALVLVLPRALQVSLVADFTLTALMLCPLVICLLPFSVGLMTVALVSGRLHGVSAKPLRRVEALSLTMSNRASSLGARLSKLSIQLSAALAPLLDWLESAFSERESAPMTAEDTDHHEQ